MGNSTIDLSLKNIWQSWFKFNKGKQHTPKMYEFQQNLENNLWQLYFDLNNKKYRHGSYSKFIVTDNKRREISVSDIRDRVVHRLIYDYLYEIYDKTFIYDAWSCRKKKGLLAAIERTQQFLGQNPNAYIWKTDIKKFFDNVDHTKLKEILKFRIKDKKTTDLLDMVIDSFHLDSGLGKGMPIGNLTSQIFSNIYLNELDRFVKHTLRVKKYLRYGDDFIILHSNLVYLQKIRSRILEFLNNSLFLNLNPGRNIIIKAKQGLKFLGVTVFSNSRKLNKRNKKRIFKRLNQHNLSSYYGFVSQHGGRRLIEQFYYFISRCILG